MKHLYLAGKLVLTILSLSSATGCAQNDSFKVISFFTAKNDQAHISFVGEAHPWFKEQAAKHRFSYDSTSNWSNLNNDFLANYDLVIFLDTRPEAPEQRAALEKYMKNGGAWMGFHFAGFALTPSDFNQDWDWYHEEFLGAGQYRSNTWRPTSAVLRSEAPDHPALKNLPDTFKTSPSEWYRWENDLTKNPDIDILLSVDSSSFPLGTGPKQHEIWHSGYYPIVWTNTRYRMIYFNFGHNDIDYDGGTNKTLSATFHNPLQDQLVINALLWLGNRK
ncbi:ThuA domain-containing protein [Imperialibacter roseus]|uniref:ThuA domain-containing protein n=1 Tax=Imperialibacter roseus TaxID=1324217 RepID=A0ABZ0INZ6_9BACT|nr:ThuA domain-containing protein [Imperialibacter roseus]WOK06189.1 ThuA domain-containing protein [Imperialibacter roseus]